MVLKNKSGQILSDTLLIIVVFSGVFLSIQAIIEKQKIQSNEYKLSKETRHEFKTTIQK